MRNVQKKRKDKSIPDTEIYELKEAGMSLREIVKHFADLGKRISVETVRQRCMKIYAKKGKEINSQRGRRIIKRITDDEIYELREQGWSYRRIAKHFEDKGIKVSDTSIKNRCKKIYEEKKQKEPSTKYKKRREDITDEEIFELREQEMSYTEIVRHFESKGIKVAVETIKIRCDKIYKQKGKDNYNKRGRKKREDITDETIYELREQGMSYSDIARYFNENNIIVSYNIISHRCKRIYKEKGKSEPVVTHRMLRKNISLEEIYELREKGLSYASIASHFKSKGIRISVECIRRRCKDIYNKKNKKEPRARYGKQEDITDDEIYELRKSGMSYKEIVTHLRKIGKSISYETIRKKCNRIFEQRVDENTRVKGGRRRKDITSEEVYSLRIKGMTYEEIATFFNSKGIKVSPSCIRDRLKESTKKTESLIEGVNSNNIGMNTPTLSELDQTLNEEIQRMVKLEKIISILSEYIKRNQEERD